MLWQRPKIDLSKLEARISKLEDEVLSVSAAQKMLRDKVLKRFRGEISQELPKDAVSSETIINQNPFMP